jgi:hypothetical protein
VVHPCTGCSSITQSVPTVVVMFGQRSPRPGRLTRLAAPTLAVLLGSGCASTDLTPSASMDPVTPPSTVTPSITPTIEEAAVTDIRITVNDQTFTAQLADNPTASDLVDQLPLTLRFRDFNRVEKIAKLPRPLTMDGVPAGDDPEINDIGYYAPSGDLVLYYGDVGYWNGIVRIGRLDAQDMSLIERQPDGFELTIDRG